MPTKTITVPHLIEVVTVADKVASVAARWKEQYGHYFGTDYVSLYGWKPEDIYAMLIALPANCGREAVDAVIGNDSWTKLGCDCCETEGHAAVATVGSDEHFISICPKCAEAVVGEFDKAFLK